MGHLGLPFSEGPAQEAGAQLDGCDHNYIFQPARLQRSVFQGESAPWQPAGFSLSVGKLGKTGGKGCFVVN